MDDPSFTDDGNDGSVSPGEGVMFNVVLRETSGHEFMWYSGVTFTVDNPEVEMGAPDWLYGIFACDSSNLGVHAKVGAGVAEGTVLHVTAHVAMLNTECPDANSVTFPVEVK